MFRSEIVKILKSINIKADENSIEKPPQEEFGDLAFPCFQLAKEQKKSPQLIAQEISKKIKLTKTSIISKVEPRGPYVNFFFNYQKVSGVVLKDVIKKKEKYGSGKSKNKTAVVEFSSPNPAHPIHIGSARNTFIGESLSRILEMSGYIVKRLCYVNDLGKQVAKLVYGYEKTAKGRQPNKKSDHWLLDVYVKSNEILSKNPELEQEVNELINKCESGDKKTLETFHKLVDWCLKGFAETYSRIGVKFDEYIWESRFVDETRKFVEQLSKNKLIFESDGAKIINLENYGLPNTVIMRSNGTGLYLTRDILSTIYKFKKYSPDLNIYVVGEEQKLHFSQLFKILEVSGYKSYSERCVHLSYGLVSIPEGKMSSRLGNVILLDDVFDEAAKRAKTHTKDDKIAESVGKAAVIYAILRIDTDKQVSFKWEEVLNLEGNTAPYIQYAHTRCSGILGKSKTWKPTYSTKDLTDYEKKLVKIISEFPQVVQQASNDLKPNYVCNYVYELATAFSEFYEKCPVIKAEKTLKDFRLTLVKAAEIVLKNALNLIGIEAVEKM